MKFTYLLVELFAVAVPFIYSFHRKIKFNKYFGQYFSANLISAIVFLIWDAAFTSAGIWGFNEKYITGIKIFNLPVEEILFFFCIPFACIFTYYCLTLFFNIECKKNLERVITILISVFLLITGALFYDRLYTSVTFISTAVMLLTFTFAAENNLLCRLYIVYLVLLIPFFIVNGILTGTGLEEPVVWYNNSEILGIRIFTIPVEDAVYGFELILLTLFLFEKFKKKYPPN